jgi:hypothetical protein
MALQPAIPASRTVQVNPGVLSAGGTARDLVGLALSASSRVPVGQVYSFATAADVGAFFGGASIEKAFADKYFLANDNKTKTPDALLFVQCPTAAVPAYLRGGAVSGLTLAQLQAISGSLTVTIDGQAFTGTVNLSTASSFSSAAALLQTALGANDATVTGSIAAGTAAVTGSIAGTTLTVTAVSSGALFAGQTISGTGVTAGTKIVSQLTGSAGGTGTYQVDTSQTASSTAVAATSTSGIMTVSAVASGTIRVGQSVAGSGVTAGTTVSALLSGSGGAGTYVVSASQTASSTTLTLGAATVTYDSQSGAFVVTGGTPGINGAISFGSNTAAAALKLDAADGAVISQGAAAVTSASGGQTPSAFMNLVAADTQNWFSLTTVGFKPSIADMVAFASWVNSQDDQFAYVMWDNDVTVTAANPTNSAGYLITAANYSGTIPIYEPSDLLHAAFLMGSIAAIDFTRTNGRRNFKFLSQSGLAPGVTSATIAAQLTANGYNYYGANANASNQWNFFAEGSVTGPFKWGDSYANQAWLNAEMQTALMTLLTSIGSVPFNNKGQALIEAALSDPINAGLNFGAITPNVPLSDLQAAEVNAACGGLQVAPVLGSRGWYIYAPIPGATVRAARGPWPVTLFYNDGGSVNSIDLASIYSEAIEAAEVQFGVDGVLSAGLIYEAVPQTITLAASSRSIDFFEQWRSSELAQQEKLFAFGTLLLPSTGAKYAMSGGVLMRYPAMPRGQKVLQPRQFGLVWESVTPAPV